MDRDETIRQQQDSIDWEGLESEIAVAAASKRDHVLQQLPSRIRSSRCRETDAAAFSKKGR